MLSRSLIEKWQFSPGVRLEPQNVAWRDREIQLHTLVEPGHLCTMQCLAASQRVTGRAMTPVHYKQCLAISQRVTAW